MNKKELLDKAFHEALTGFNFNAMEHSDITEDIIAMSMKAFAKRENIDFTQDEIKATIIAGIDTIREAGKDFSYQDRMMF